MQQQEAVPSDARDASVLTGVAQKAPDGPFPKTRITLALAGGREVTQWVYLIGGTLSIVAATEPDEGIQPGDVFVRRAGSYVQYAHGLYHAIRAVENTAASINDRVEAIRVTERCAGWAMEACWEAPSGEDAAYAQTYRDALAAPAGSLEMMRDPLVVDVVTRLKKASDPHDRLGRINWMSRSAIHASITRRTQKWLTVNHQKSARVDLTRLSLVGELERVWDIRENALREVREMSRWAQADRQQKLVKNRERQLLIAKRCDDAAAWLAQVAVAPFNRHAFRQCITDLTAAADLLRQPTPDVPDAVGLIVNTASSLTLAGFGRRIEEMLVIASKAEHGTLEVTPADATGFQTDTDAIIVILKQNTLDQGFRRPIIADVVECLQTAKLAAAPTFRADEVKTHLQLAAKCF